MCSSLRENDEKRVISTSIKMCTQCLPKQNKTKQKVYQKSAHAGSFPSFASGNILQYSAAYMENPGRCSQSWWAAIHELAKSLWEPPALEHAAPLGHFRPVKPQQPESEVIKHQTGTDANSSRDMSRQTGKDGTKYSSRGKWKFPEWLQVYN